MKNVILHRINMRNDYIYLDVIQMLMTNQSNKLSKVQNQILINKMHVLCDVTSDF